MRRLALCMALSLLGLHAFGASALAEASKQASSARSTKKRKAPKKRPAKASTPKESAPKPPTKLPGPIEIARVHVEVAEDRVLVTSEIAFGKGEWEHGDLRAHVAYGAPGVPIAFEAHLCAPGEDGSEPECRALPHDFSRTAPSDTAFVIGPAKMAGETIELEEKDLAAIFARHPHAILRLRQLRPLPLAGASGHREVLVRLGELRGSPHRLGAIEIEGKEGLVISDADARLCGFDVKPTELSVLRGGVASKGVPPRLLHRAGHEDLCLRFRY